MGRGSSIQIGYDRIVGCCGSISLSLCIYEHLSNLGLYILDNVIRLGESPHIGTCWLLEANLDLQGSLGAEWDAYVSHLDKGGIIPLLEDSSVWNVHKSEGVLTVKLAYHFIA